MKIEYKEFEVIPAGVYQATVHEIEPAEGQFGAMLKWSFYLGEGKYITGITSTKLSSNSKMFEWADAAAGGLLDLRNGFDTASVLGKPVQVIVKNYQDDKGEKRHRVDGLLPVGGGTVQHLDDEEFPPF